MHMPRSSLPALVGGVIDEDGEGELLLDVVVVNVTPVVVGPEGDPAALMTDEDEAVDWIIRGRLAALPDDGFTLEDDDEWPFVR
jgi:hypothetical protein